MSRVFADITSKHHEGIAEKDPTAPSPKTRRLNLASRKISREIRLAVLAQDVIALKAALKAAEELDMDTHLIKAARASLHDLENHANDENLAPGYDSKNCTNVEFKTPIFEPSLEKARPGESTVDSKASILPESSSNVSFESNSESDGFFATNDFENLAPEGEKESTDFNTCYQRPIAYSLNLPQRPVLDHQRGKAQIIHSDEGKPIDEEGWSSEMNHYKNYLQPAFSERIARIKFESTKIDACCKDFCHLLKLQHSAQEKSSDATAELADEINTMGMTKTGMTIDATGAMIQSQILARSNKARESITNLRKEFIVPILSAIPAIEIEIRSLFEEAAFLESECNKAMTDLERTNKQVPDITGGSKDDSDCFEPVTLREARRLSGIGITVREPRRLSGIGVSILRRPSVANRSDGEYFCQYEHTCAKVEAEIIFKQVLSEYTRRVPEIVQAVAELNSKRVQLITNAFSGAALADQRRLEEELLEQKNLLSVMQQTDVEKDLSNIRCLSEMKTIISGSYHSSTDESLITNSSSEAHFTDPNRERSFAVDLWAGNGIDVALEHVLSSKQTICSLHQLIASIAHILQQKSELLSKSVKLVQAQVNTEQARIGDLQWHAFQTLINATRIQAASYDACATSLRQTLAELRFQKQMLKSIHRTITEGRARSLKDFNASMAYQTKCKDLRDKLELERSNSQKLVLDHSSSYRTCPNQAQLEGFLSKLERDERSFRQADLAYRNAQHSIQASRETQAIMQCQFLSKLQTAEESRLQCCLKTFRTLGYGVRDLVNAVEQSDLDVMSAFAAVDINKDLRQFIKSTYPAESDIKSSDIDYVTLLSSDGFGPAYDYALSGLLQMKHMLVLLEHWADSSEYVKFLSKIKTVAPNTELSSIQAALLQCQHLVFGFCQSVDDHAASHREIIANVDKQRHLLKAEARKIRKKFATVHRRVTLAIQNHSQAAETQRRLTEKLQAVRQQNANASQVNVNAGKFNLSKFFSRDLSKTLHKTEEGVSSSKTALDKLQQELSAAIRERESVVKSSLHSLQELENNRIAALSWCIPTLINHRQEISSQIADVAQCLISSCEDVDIKADLQLFIRSNSLGVSPPGYLFERVLALGVACGEKSSNCSKSRDRFQRYNSEEEEGISRSTFSVGEETSAAPSDSIFGGNLTNSPVQNGVSKIVATCITFLTSRQSQITATTFREPCPAEDVNAVMNEFRRDPDTVLVTQTVSCVASVLKTYISELQPALIPSNMVSEFLTIYKNACASQRCSRITHWLNNLPAVHRNTLKLVLLFLSEISRCPTSQATNMAVTNLAISWSPVLLQSAVGTTIQALSRLLHDTPTIFNDSGESG